MATTCSVYPTAGAWFSEPVAWRGTQLLTPYFGIDEFEFGSWACPSHTESANGWFHISLGTAPTA